jgi:hypothetical protein
MVNQGIDIYGENNNNLINKLNKIRFIGREEGNEKFSLLVIIECAVGCVRWVVLTTVNKLI